MTNLGLDLDEISTAATALGIQIRSERSGLELRDYRALETALREPTVSLAEGTQDLEAAQSAREIQEADRSPSDPVWPLIGTEAEITYLSPEDVLTIHEKLVMFFSSRDDPIDPPGVRDDFLLMSATDRPRTALGAISKYPSVTMAGAALFHAIVHNHPFHNGNKRTAMVSILEFLRRNGAQLNTDVDKDQLYAFALDVARHRIKTHEDSWPGSDSEVLGIAQWLQQHTRRTQKGEKTLSFGQLQGILRNFGCEIKRSTGNRVEIRRAHRVCKITSAGDGRECDKGTVSKIRKELELDARNGFDSVTFYEKGDPVQEFIMEYRELLAELAKT